METSKKLLTSGFLLIACIAAALPFAENRKASSKIAHVVWPNSFEGTPLVELPLSQLEQRVFTQFPGQVKRFQVEHAQLIIRQVYKATRKLHPASDCYRALGYTISKHRRFQDGSGRNWSQFDAIRNDVRLSVRELVVAKDGTHWPDIGYWYWQALWRSDTGPWTSYLVAEPYSDS